MENLPLKIKLEGKLLNESKEEEELSLEDIVFKFIEETSKVMKISSGFSRKESLYLKEQMNRLLNPYYLYNLDKENIKKKVEGMYHLDERLKRIIITIVEVLEIASTKNEKKNKVVITNPEEVFRQFYHLRFSSNEIFKVLYLNSKNELIKSKDLAIGSYRSIIVKPSDIFILAVKYNARNIILIHNHPSGNPKPSEEDLEFTRKIQDSAKILGLSLIDHVIIGDGFYSFKYHHFI